MLIRDNSLRFLRRHINSGRTLLGSLIIVSVAVAISLLDSGDLTSSRPSGSLLFGLAVQERSVYISYSNFRLRYRVRVEIRRGQVVSKFSSSPPSYAHFWQANQPTPQPPPITYPICLSKSDYLKAFGTLSFPQANQLPVYSWDGGPGCPTQKKAAGNAGGGGGGAATPLAVAIDQLWTTQGAKLLPPPSGSFDPPTAITGARVYLVSRSVPSVSIDLTFHGATLAFDATSALWVQWSPGDPVAGPFPPTSSGWPSGAIHHTYSEPGPHSVEVTERWQVVWSFDGHSGVLPAVVRTAALPLKVQTLRRILLAPA